jgi:photosystem II stability/assembly factor-like uncharacterized protein
MADSPAPSGSGSGRHRSPFARVVWFGAALALFAASSFVAFRQEPRPDAFRRPSPLAADWWLHPIERNAPRRLPLVWGNLNDVFALRGTGKVWAVGEGGLVLHSDDYGRHWTRQYLVPPDAPAAAPKPAAAGWLRELTPNDPLAAITLLAMVPSPGPVKGPQSVDQGANAPPPTPPRQPPPTLGEVAKSTLWSVQFVDESYGWVAGANSALFATRDGGERWERQDSGAGSATLLALIMSDRVHGRLIGDDGIERETGDGHTWKISLYPTLTGDPTALREKRVYRSIPRDPANRARFYGAVARLAPLRKQFIDCDLLDDRLWGIGALGLARSIDGGTTWVRSAVDGAPKLRAVSFADLRHGWMAGGDGILLASDDGGATWFRQSRPVPALGADAAANTAAVARELARYGEYSIWPAPLYCLSLLFVALLLVPALKTPPAEVDPRPSVAGLLVSDRPIEAGEADVFDFNAVALGLSRFLRNEKTEPPLTIAITGEWGSGKSSLMNLLRGDLRRYGFRPVWFNAWHHQKEDNLLASLLETVRAQAIPAAWRPEGMIYRGRLLLIRWARYWPAVALLLLAFSVSAGYIRSDPRRVDEAQRLVDSWSTKVGSVFSALAGNASASKAGEPATAGAKSAAGAAGAAPAGEHVPVAGLLLSALGLAVSIWKGVKGFGVDPASLLARDSGRIKDLQALTGFRQRFAAEFRDVTRALNPRTMLILIDDLDRCRPENVLEVLEAVNFLVSSGDCFVVLGMARDRVLRCVGLSFKDVADELLDPVAAPSAAPASPGAPAPPAAATAAADLARQRRLDFGQQYLEKLINIEVPVPVPTDEQSRRLLAASEPQEETPEARRRRRRQEIWTWTRKLAPFAGFALLLAAGFYYGLTRPPEPYAPVAASPVSQPAASPGGTSVHAAAAPAAARQVPEPTLGDPVSWRHRPLAALALLLVGLGVWRLSIPPDVVIRDSREFEQALATWHPLLFSWHNTPRSIKRYLNRVRYLAMLQRPAAPEPTLGRRLLDSLARRWQRLRKRPEPAAALSAAKGERLIIPEDFLVALSAIDCCHPELLRDRRRLGDFFHSGLHDESLSESICTLAADPEWAGTLESFLGRYLEMASGIHVS